MVFHWSLRDSKSPQVSRTLLSILSDLINAVVWMVFTRPPTSKSSRPFINPLVTVTRAPITICSAFFWSSLVRYYYYYYYKFSILFSVSYNYSPDLYPRPLVRESSDSYGFTFLLSLFLDTFSHIKSNLLLLSSLLSLLLSKVDLLTYTVITGNEKQQQIQ